VDVHQLTARRVSRLSLRPVEFGIETSRTGPVRAGSAALKTMDASARATALSGPKPVREWHSSKTGFAHITRAQPWPCTVLQVEVFPGSVSVPGVQSQHPLHGSSAMLP
jgi:hypothetical protein